MISPCNRRRNDKEEKKKFSLQRGEEEVLFADWNDEVSETNGGWWGR